MSEYIPDYWGIIKIKTPDGILHHRIIASWAGSYLGSSSWKISSGIESFDLVDSMYVSNQSSGSVYRLNVGYERLNGYAQSIFNNYREDFVKQYGEGNFTFDIISSEEYLKSLEQ